MVTCERTAILLYACICISTCTCIIGWNHTSVFAAFRWCACIWKRASRVVTCWRLICLTVSIAEDDQFTLSCPMTPTSFQAARSRFPDPTPLSPRPCSVFNDPLVVSVYECGLLMHSGLPTPVATSTRLVHAINLMSLCDVTVWCWRHERTWLRHTPDKAMFFSECPCSISSSRHLSTADLFPYYYCYIIRV